MNRCISRGPWAPCTRVASMSAVLLGPWGWLKDWANLHTLPHSGAYALGFDGYGWSVLVRVDAAEAMAAGAAVITSKARALLEVTGEHFDLVAGNNEVLFAGGTTVRASEATATSRTAASRIMIN